MKTSILITGISGAGKSTTSHKLRELGYTAYDMEDDFDGLFTMLDKKTGQPMIDHDNTDLQKVQNIDWICDVNKLRRIIENEKSELTFYCGSASNIDEILPLFNIVILLAVSSKVARQRLTTRQSNDFGRTKEIQDWLMSFQETWEQTMKDKGAIVIDADQELDVVASEIIKNVL